MEVDEQRKGEDPDEDLDKADVENRTAPPPDNDSPTGSLSHEEEDTEHSSVSQGDERRASGWRSESPETAAVPSSGAAAEGPSDGTTELSHSRAMGAEQSTSYRTGGTGPNDGEPEARTLDGAVATDANPRRSAAPSAARLGDVTPAKDRGGRASSMRRFTDATTMLTVRSHPRHEPTPPWLVALRPTTHAAPTPAKRKSQQTPRSRRTAPGTANELTVGPVPATAATSTGAPEMGPGESSTSRSASNAEERNRESKQSSYDVAVKGRTIFDGEDHEGSDDDDNELCYQQSLAPGAYRMAPGCNPEPASSTAFPPMRGIGIYDDEETASTANRTSSGSRAAMTENLPALASSQRASSSLATRLQHPLGRRVSDGPDAFLAEANLVVDEPAPTLVEAKIIRRKRQICLVIVAILGGTGLLLGLILGLAAPVVSTSRSQGGGPTESPTSTPTASPTTALDRDFRSVLPAVTLLALDNETSAQHRAYAWATEEDRIPHVYHPENATARLEHMKRRFALATLYFSTGGDVTWRSGNNGFVGSEGLSNETSGNHWLDGMLNECVWAGCLCDVGSTIPRSVNLQAESLAGPLPPEIGLLGDGLVELVLSQNALTGTIPTELGALTRLETLDLEDNLLSLQIPTEIGRMMNLERLKLNSNGLDGIIPSELGKLSKLKTLMLSENLLRSSVPTELCSLKGNLEVLQLSSNAFTGAIPPCFGSLLMLSDLRLNQNQLTGPIPSNIGNLTHLSALDLSNNGLTGSFVTQLGHLTKLVDLKLYRNQFSRTIPTELGRLTQLKFLHCYENALTGPLPSELGSLRLLKELLAQGKDGDSLQRLNSTLPTEVGLLQNLEVLDVSANLLSGRIPEEVGSLTSLRELRLSNNRLNGTFPRVIGQLKKLEVLHLAIATLPDESTLTGSIPTELGLLTNLVEVDLRLCNFMKSSIPTTVGLLSNLVTFLVSNSQLSGPVPTELGRLTNLQALDLFGNSLEGTIPTELGNLVELEELYLGFNQLNGTIPTELGRLSNLQEVNLGAGNLDLTGTVPAEFCNIKIKNGLEFVVDCDALACACDCDCTYRDDLYY